VTAGISSPYGYRCGRRQHDRGACDAAAAQGGGHREAPHAIVERQQRRTGDTCERPAGRDHERHVMTLRGGRRTGGIGGRQELGVLDADHGQADRRRCHEQRAEQSRGRPTTINAKSPAVAAAIDPRENVSNNVAPSAGEAAAASTLTVATSRSSAVRPKDTTMPIAASRPSAFQ
jgi:hypothetical protein